MLQNAHRIEGDVAYIVLTLGQEAKIDAADLPIVLSYRWYAGYIPAQGTYYARTTAPGGKRLSMHRLLMQPGDGEWVDHINHDTLDNRRSVNLRLVSPSGNAINRSRHRPNRSTGIVGVSVMRQKRDDLRYYLAAVSRDGKTKRRIFPHTPQGLEDAAALIAKWQEDFTYEPDRSPRPRAAKRWAPPVRTSTGIRGVSIQQYGKHGKSYAFRCLSKHCPVYKRFPLTDEGLAGARAYAEAHHAEAREHGYYA